MSDADSLLPPSPLPDLIPTLNHTGWMTKGLDAVSQAFTEYAGTLDSEVLDIGCAYGVATLAALAAGARVLASDMEPRHLEILGQRTPPADRGRLRCQAGTMPEIDFPAASFGAILCARAVHFLHGKDIELTVRKMHDWLIPGGRLYLVADSPYIGPWATAAPEYERRKAAGDPWPGFIADFRSLLPASADTSSQAAFLNPLDPDILRRVAVTAGFEVIEARWLSGAAPRSAPNTHAGMIARRPGP